MRTLGKAAAVLAALVAVVAALANWQPWEGADKAVDPATDRAIAEAVTTRTLTEEITVRGELRRDELQTIVSATDGWVSGLVVDDGDTVSAGDVLYSLDGRVAVAVNGEFAFYRQLGVGSDGPDVRQLEAILSDAGYAAGEVDGLFTEETRSGLAAWQADHGYGGVDSEVDEVVNVTLGGNPAGYTVGAVNTVSVLIGPAAGPAPRARRATAADAAAVPTVTLEAAEAIVTEGGRATFTVTADPAPTADLEVAVRVAGEVTPDDHEAVDATVRIAAGSRQGQLVVTTVADELREPHEDLEVVISGQFADAGGIAPHDLVIYDLQEAIEALLERESELAVEIAEADLAPQELRVFDLQASVDDLGERRAELVVEVADAREEVAGLESRQAEKTDVEQELIDKGIITMSQAYSADLTPTEAANLISLDSALEQANNDLDAERITVAARTQAFDAYNDALTAALETSAELTTARDSLTALERELDRQSYLLGVAEADLADAVETTSQVVAGLVEEQNRLAFSLEARREELRSARGARYLVGDPDTAVVILDDPGVEDVPTLVLRSTSGTFGEAGSASFTVETQDPLVEDLEVYYQVSGSAAAGHDYTQPDGDVVMRAGQESVAITVQLRPDDLVEVDEELTVTLLEDPAGGYALSPVAAATVRIVSDDLPELTLTGGGRIREGATAFVTVVADQAPTVDTSVSYSVGGSARAGEDFEVLAGTAVLPAGQLTLDIPVRSLADDVVFMPGDMVVAGWPARVGTVHVDSGQFLQRGSPVLTLTEPSLTVKLFATPSNRAQIAVGQSATVNLEAGDQETAGTIAQIDDSATTSGGNETYEGVVETEEELIGVDGAVVTVDVVVAESVDAVVVPIAAVLSDGGVQKVRVVTRDGVIERRTVETGMLDGAYVEVRAGLSVGEYVILEIDRS